MKHGNDDYKCIYDNPEPDRECVSTFARGYLRHGVVHLTASEAEVNRLTDFAMGIWPMTMNEGSDESLAVILGAAWLHTGALFDGEFGDNMADEQGRRPFSAFERAEWIGNLLSSRGAGATSINRYDNDIPGDLRWTDGQQLHLASVLNAAIDGTITDAAVARQLVREHAMGIDEDRADEWIDYGTHSLSQRRDRAAEWMSDRLRSVFWSGLTFVSLRASFRKSQTPQHGGMETPRGAISVLWTECGHSLAGLSLTD